MMKRRQGPPFPFRSRGRSGFKHTWKPCEVSAIMKNALESLPVKWNWKTWTGEVKEMFPTDKNVSVRGTYRRKKVFFEAKMNGFQAKYSMDFGTGITLTAINIKGIVEAAKTFLKLDKTLFN